MTDHLTSEAATPKVVIIGGGFGGLNAAQAMSARRTCCV